MDLRDVKQTYRASACLSIDRQMSISKACGRPGRHLLPNGERLVLCDWDFDHGLARGELMVLSAAGWQRHALT